MSDDRVRGLFFSSRDFPEPRGVFMYVEMPDGNERMHACYSRVQAFAVLAAATGTTDTMRTRCANALGSCGLSPVSDVQAIIVHGWAAAALLSELVKKGPKPGRQDIDRFERSMGYVFSVFQTKHGSGVLLAESHPNGHHELWMLKSRLAVRARLAAIREFADEELYEVCMNDLEASPLPEEDDAFESVRVIGALASTVARIIFCSDSG